MGKQLDSALEQRGMPKKNGAVLYLILSVIGFGFIGWILMQNTINSRKQNMSCLYFVFRLA